VQRETQVHTRIVRYKMNFSKGCEVVCNIGKWWNHLVGSS